MSIELFVLGDGEAFDRDGAGRVTIGVGASDDRADVERTAPDGQPLRLVFRALFREDHDASEWEYRVKERLEKSGVRVGNEYFFVSDAMVESLCDAAAHAEQHEWLIEPADSGFFELAMELGRARRDVDEAFSRWSKCGRTPSAEIRVHSYEQHVARNENRVRELTGSYVTPRFYNDGDRQNEKLDYAISRLKEESRKWRSEIVRLRRQIEESELAFGDWQVAVGRVNRLEKQLAEKANPSS